MKLLVSLLLAVSLVFVTGCGKKNDLNKSSKKTTKLSKNNEIPMYDCDGLELFDQDNRDFAFVAGKDKTAKTAKGNVTDEDLQLSWNGEDGEKAFNPVLFTFNKYDIREDQKAIAEKDTLLAKDATTEGHKVVVQGHADKFGSASYNLALSEKRAFALKEEMVAKGIEADKVEIVGFGQELPLVWTDATDRETQIKDLQPNRRAEVVIAS